MASQTGSQVEASVIIGQNQRHCKASQTENCKIIFHIQFIVEDLKR